MTLKEKLEPLLLKVQKPARYIGGELNSVMKDKNKVETRVALCFPDNYEIGMSHLGLKILYSLINEREDCWAERVYAPGSTLKPSCGKTTFPSMASRVSIPSPILMW